MAHSVYVCGWDGINLYNVWQVDIESNGAVSVPARWNIGAATYSIYSVVVSPAEDALFTVGTDNILRKFIADFAAPDPSFGEGGELAGYTSPVRIALHADLSVSGAKTGSPYFMKVSPTGATQLTTPGAGTQGRDVSFLPNGNILFAQGLSGSEAGILIDKDTGAQLAAYGIGGTIYKYGKAIACDLTGDYVYLSSSNTTGITGYLSFAKFAVAGGAPIWQSTSSFSEKCQTCILVHSSGRLYTAGRNALGGTSCISEWNPATGVVVNQYFTGSSVLHMIEDRFGHVVAAGIWNTGEDGEYSCFRVFDTDLTLLGNINTGTANYPNTSLFFVGASTTSPPSISDQTASPVSAENGIPFSLSVTATGTEPLTYQWKLDGVAISGATSSTYAVADPVTESAGTYTCVVENAYGSATSADIDVVVAPYITTQPTASTQVRAGNSLSLSVTGGGGPALLYQWRLNGTPISGATSAGYTVPHVLEEEAGNYTCTLSLAASPELAVTTDTANVIVLPSLSGVVFRMFDIPIDNDAT